MKTSIRYLLLQVRKPGDPMANHEVKCFARHLDCDSEAIDVHNLIEGSPAASQINQVDVVLIGGSGDFSVVSGGRWLAEALELMGSLHDQAKPTFASCWGFQALSLALGGRVVTDQRRAEVGTITLTLTPEGLADPIFRCLGATFEAQMGHQDIVEKIPPGAISLAASGRVEHQAFCFPGRPIYGTQFHPELDQDTLLDRLRTYPEYIKRATGLDYDDFVRQRCRPSPATAELLRRFVSEVLA